MQSYTNGMIGAGEADPNEGVSRKPFRRSFTAPEDQEVEIFQAKNFLMAIFVGSDAESVINNGAIERRLGYYIFEIFAAINSNKGSIRYAPFHFTSSTSSTATSSSTTTQTSKKSFYPSPLEVRKFIFLRQISLFPWHFPLSRITLPTHVGFHLVGTTAKQETVQLFFLLPQRDTDLVLRAFETAFPRNYRDFLQTPSPLSSSSSLFSSSAAAQSLSLSKESSTTVDEISQIQQRHNCAAPLWQQDAIKVSFYHIRTSAWSAWQWCSVRIHQFYPAPIHNLSGMNHIHSIVIAAPLVSSNIKNSASGTQQTRNNLMSMLISSPTGQQQSTLVAAKQKRLDVAGREEEFFLPKIDLSEGQLYAGKEQRYFLYNVSLCLADVAVARRNSLKKRNSIKKNKFNQNNKLNRKLFTDDDETRDEAKHAARSAGDYGFFDAGDEEDEEEEDFTLEKTVLRIRCQQLLPSLPSSITAPINASGSVDVTRISQTEAASYFEDVQLHVELPRREMALEFALACAQLSHENSDGLLDFAQQLLQQLQEESTRFAKYKILAENNENVLRRFMHLREQAESEVATALSPAKPVGHNSATKAGASAYYYQFPNNNGNTSTNHNRHEEAVL